MRRRDVGAPAKAAFFTAVILDSADSQRRADRVGLAHGAGLQADERLVGSSWLGDVEVEHLADGPHQIIRDRGMCEPRVAPCPRAVFRTHLRYFRRQHDNRRRVAVLWLSDLTAQIPSGHVREAQVDDGAVGQRFPCQP